MFRRVSTRFAGLVILIAGLWGGLVPFVGPYFHFALGPNHSWTWTSGRFYLSVLPAIAAVVGGLMLIAAGPRVSGKIGALLALAGGVWFAIGPDVSLLWHAGGAQGVAHGHKVTRMLELITYHTGLGVLIAAFAAYALPGAAGRRTAEAEAAAGVGAGAAGTAAVRPRRRRFGFFGRRRAAPAEQRAVPAREPGTTAEPAATAEPATRTESEPATRETEPATRKAEPAEAAPRR
jgi:hypothetical protein